MPGTENKAEDSSARGAGPRVGRHNAMSAVVKGCPGHVGSLRGGGAAHVKGTLKGRRLWIVDHPMCVSLWEPAHETVLPLPRTKA